MNSQVVALMGALIGASTTLVGSLLSHWLTMKREQEQWSRQQQAQWTQQRQELKEETYERAIRYILRARNKRSTLTARGEAILDSQYVKEWVDDLIESQLAIDRLITLANKQEQSNLSYMSQTLKLATDAFLTIPVLPIETAPLKDFEGQFSPPEMKAFGVAENLLAKLDEIHQLLIQSASRDLQNM